MRSLQTIAGFDQVVAMQTWLGPFPRVNYSLGEIAPPTATRVTVAVSGPDAHMVQEPLVVQLKDTANNTQRRTLAGAGVADFNNTHPVATVELDPDGRLAELWHEPGLMPRYDNRDPKRWRFLLNDISGLFAVTNGQLSLAIDFLLRRINDLRFDIDFAAFYAPGFAGVQVSADRYFGAEVTPLRLAQALSLTAQATHLRQELDASVPGDQVGLALEYQYDTRLGRYWDYQGQAVDASVSYTLGRDAHDTSFQFGQAGVAGLRLWPLGLNAAWVTRVRVDAIFGQAPPQNQLRLGGRYLGARGYENDEARGTRRLLLSQELRHVLHGESRNDLFGLLMLTRLEGAFFADAVYLPIDRSGCHQSWFYDVGYGVRFIADVLNLSPVSLQLDVGVPLNRCADRVDIKTPVTVYLSFVQSFLAF